MLKSIWMLYSTLKYSIVEVNGFQNCFLTNYSSKYLSSFSTEKNSNLNFWVNYPFNVSIVYHLAVCNARTHPVWTAPYISFSQIYIFSIIHSFHNEKEEKNTTSKWIQQAKTAPIQNIEDLKEAQTACWWWMVMYSSLFSMAFHLLQFIIACASIKTFGFGLSVWSPSITDACTRSIWHLGSHPETSDSQILRPLSFIPEGNSCQWGKAAISGEDRREQSTCCKDAKAFTAAANNIVCTV